MNRRPVATAYVASVSRRMLRRTQLSTILGLCVFIGFTLLLLNSAQIPSLPNHPPASESPSTRIEKPLSPSNESPSTRIEKALSPSTGHFHPIHQLINKAEAELEELKKGQSQSLDEAVKEYRRRYKIPPPPHFDKWYEFAKEKGVELIDEYDMIYHSLLPFWALQPPTIRRRAQEALGFDNALLGLLIRDGRVISAAGGNEWQQKSTTAMIKSFVKYLPDMDLPFNVHDEPRVTVPHDDLSRLVARAKDKTMPAAFKNQALTNSWSPRPADVGDGTRFNEFKTTRFNKFAHQPTWTNSRISCSPDSPSRGLEDTLEDDPTSFSFSELGFVSNKTAFSDICLSPSLRERFGFFNRPNAYDIVHDLFPVFSQSKISSYQDILYPSPWYWSEKVAYQEGQDYAWDKKRDQMYWRGSTTGGFSRDGGWRRQHRQLFVEQVNALGTAKILEHQNSSHAGEWKVREVQRPDYQDLFNVKFSHIGQCDPEDCHAQTEFFEVVKPAKQHDAWAYKYLLDMDGNAFSGRFYAFLKSQSLIYKVAMFREWHDEWLRPWVHYIPLSLRGDEYVESVRYFQDEETGRIQGSKIAHQGRDWAGRVLRNEDLEVWLFRLLLEWAPLLVVYASFGADFWHRYGRLVDDHRPSIGYGAA